jgi:hypothetical protein
VSGETERNISAWTNDTVLIHLGALMDAADRRYMEKFRAVSQQMSEKDVRDQQRFDAQQLALRDALLAQEKAVSAALLAAQEAVSKAETAAEKRFDAVNEFRAQLADQAATLMPRSEATVVFDGQNEKISALEKRVNQGTGRAEGLTQYIGWLIGAAGIIAAIVVAVTR